MLKQITVVLYCIDILFFPLKGHGNEIFFIYFFHD